MLAVCFLLPALIPAGQKTLKDKPIKGKWDFGLEKIWQVNTAGPDQFGRIAELLVSDQGNIYMRDFERNISYIFDGEGRFVKSFALQGDGPGQLSHYLNRFNAGGKLVLASPEKLHFFSRDGVFSHAVDNNLFLRFPLQFLNENEFIYAPNLPHSPVHDKKLMVHSITSGEDRLLVDFSEPEVMKKKPAPGPMVMIFGLTPQVSLARAGDKMVFGRSDRYEIFTANKDGKILSSSNLDRKNQTATEKDKRSHFADVNIPPDQIENIVSQLPETMTFFSRIDVLNGFIHVLPVTGVGAITTSQPVDIFSMKGEYLYQGHITFGGLKFGSPSNISINGGYLYVILEDDNGRRILAKYRIKLPG